MNENVATDDATRTPTEGRKLVVSEFLSLDGVMQAPGGADEDRSGGFEHGGWQMPYFDDAAGAAITEGMESSDTFLIGRKTYEIMAAYWPDSTEEIAEVMNERPKFVASTTLFQIADVEGGVG